MAANRQPADYLPARRNWLGGTLSVAGWLVLPLPLKGLAATTHEIVISSLVFAPQQISARAGDRVTWRNDDIVPHTATATDHSWDTGIIEPGQQITLEIPAGAGAGAGAGATYYCLYHPSMKGRIR
ncbi:hypothetical protein [Aliamphritea spongicola]|uniref:hypothetical protein n=1 Tax=Aliamphritea spongicola TaxID=707589 RepID=UPI00196A9CEE|nr:hypothetical protein [Aliamphritea spongicola]MBN3562180.1 hypothetical protein [Aliamphritea spongicola]